MNMELILLSLFSLFSLVLLVIGWQYKNPFLGIAAGLCLIIIGAFILQDGIGITYSGAYGVYNNETQEVIYGMTSETVTHNDPFTLFWGGAFMLVGIGNFILSVLYAVTESEEEE